MSSARRRAPVCDVADSGALRGIRLAPQLDDLDGYSVGDARGSVRTEASRFLCFLDHLVIGYGRKQALHVIHHVRLSDEPMVRPVDLSRP